MSLTKHIPNAITSMNLLSGIMGVVCALQGRIDIAFPLMLLAALFDFCDGLAARMLHAYSDMGKELDSLSDMVSFGVLPALMLVNTMQEYGCTGWMCWIPLFLAVMSAVRLAKFNVDTRQSTDFLGLPTPSSAMLCGALTYYISSGEAPFLGVWAGTKVFLPLVAIVLGLLLVSEIPMFSFKIAKGHKIMDAKHVVFLCLAVIAVAVTVILRQNWSLAVLLLFVSYILENVVLYAVSRFK